MTVSAYLTEPWLSVDAAAALIGIAVTTVRQHCRSGLLPAEKIGPAFVIRRGDAQALRAARKRGDIRPGRPRGPVVA